VMPVGTPDECHVAADAGTGGAAGQAGAGGAAGAETDAGTVDAGPEAGVGGAPAKRSEDVDGGCSCRSARSMPNDRSAAWLIFGLVWALRRRRGG
jgi:hypothetical protein